MPQLMRSEKAVELWTNYFDIVILPPPPIRDYAIDLSDVFSGRHNLHLRTRSFTFLPARRCKDVVIV
jgi:hypothetical protein